MGLPNSCNLVCCYLCWYIWQLSPWVINIDWFPLFSGSSAWPSNISPFLIWWWVVNKVCVCVVSLARKIEEIILEFSPKLTTSWGDVVRLQNFSRKTPLMANSPTCTVCIKTSLSDNGGASTVAERHLRGSTPVLLFIDQMNGVIKSRPSKSSHCYMGTLTVLPPLARVTWLPRGCTHWNVSPEWTVSWWSHLMLGTY